MQDRKLTSFDAEQHMTASNTNQAEHGYSTYLKHAFFGGLSGLFMEGTLHPIDTIRTRIKSNKREVVPFFRQAKLMKIQEGPLSYFRGFTCTLVGALAANGTYFYIYEAMRHKLVEKHILSKETSPFVAAFVGSVMSNFISLPFDVVRTRMQLTPGKYEYGHFFDGARQILKHEGFRKLYLGGPAFFALTSLEMSLTFGFYELFYGNLKHYFHSKHDVNVPLSIACSVTAAGLAGFMVNPLDVLVTRIQSVNTLKHGHVGMIEMSKRIYHNEGLKGFMKGASGTVSYYALGAFLLFPTYEVLKSVFHVELDA